LSGEVPRLRSSGGLPPLTTASNAEVERLRSENAELKQMVAEYREHIETNQLQDWEQKIQEAEQLLSEKDTLIESLQKQVGEWEEKLKTNRFVPSDDDLAQMADELDKERSQFAQERKQLDLERKQLKEDEESLMKQMREMEVGMAKDRAELARQRTELQRTQIEVRHELELLQRGDATMKDRLAQFQRRGPDPAARPAGPQMPMQMPQQPMAPGGPEASPLPQSDRPRESGVFRRLFGQNG
jgi:chromosome segregation ATPase